MTAFDGQLLLRLRLDALPGGRVPDSSSHTRHGTVTGRPTVVPDDRFGSSVRFAGTDSVEVPDVTPSAGGRNPVLSVACWVLLDTYPAKRSWLLTLGQAGAGALRWLVDADGHAQVGGWDGAQVTIPLPLGTWVHVATTYDGTTLRCYLDGRPWGEAVRTTFDYSAWTFDLAKPRQGDAGYAGRLVGLRVYERALSEDDIRAVIDEDSSAMAAFRRSHPLSFDLHDRDDQPVLAIVDDPTGQVMRLDVTNDASRTIVLNPIDPSTGKNHLELTFRPGVLPADRLDRITVGAPHDWTSQVRTSLDGTVVFGLTSTKQREIKANETIHFGLNNIGADGRGGTRGTRVQLGYDQMSYADDPSALTGTRVQYLNIVNRRGQQQIPLDMGFIGFNSILSDGHTTDRLRLRIVNVSSSPLPLVPSGQDEASAFVISFDVQRPGAPVNEWALCRPQDLKSISVTADRWVAAPPSEEGDTLAWRLTSPTQIAIAPDDDIHVTIDGLIGLPPSGHTTMHVHYENIPGYWDGYLTAVIEKGPLICRDMPLPDDRVDARVGIGTAKPQAKLQVTGGAIMPSMGASPESGIYFPPNALGAGDGAWLWYYQQGRDSTRLELGITKGADYHLALMASGGVGVNTRNPGGKLHVVHTNQDANGNTLIIGPTHQSHLRLGYHEDYSWVQSHGAKPLSINPIGNLVGIGRTAPDGMLDVARGSGAGGTALFRGTNRISHFNYSTDEHTFIRGGKANSHVFLNDTGGSVVVGGTDPKGHKLLVNGPAKVSGLRVNSDSLFGRMQWGHFHAGPHSGIGVKEVQISFPERFGAKPYALVAARSEGYHPDTFAVTVKYIDAGLFKVNVQRTDRMNASWEQALWLDWIAWE